MTLSWQDSLFGPEPGPPLSFDRLVRHRLDSVTWVDEVPGWAPDHASVFDLLAADAPWQQRTKRCHQVTP